MKGLPRVGATGELTAGVDEGLTISFAGQGMPAVLSTPALVGLLERAAREALAPFLEPGENSVGAEIDIRHLAPTPPGMKVTCLARVVHAEGNTIDFQLEARDERELIARGVHRRHVIQVDRFAKRVRAKSADGQTN